MMALSRLARPRVSAALLAIDAFVVKGRLGARSVSRPSIDARIVTTEGVSGVVDPYSEPYEPYGDFIRAACGYDVQSIPAVGAPSAVRTFDDHSFAFSTKSRSPRHTSSEPCTSVTIDASRPSFAARSLSACGTNGSSMKVNSPR